MAPSQDGLLLAVTIIVGKTAVLTVIFRVTGIPVHPDEAVSVALRRYGPPAVVQSIVIWSELADKLILPPPDNVQS